MKKEGILKRLKNIEEKKRKQIKLSIKEKENMIKQGEKQLKTIKKQNQLKKSKIKINSK